MAFSKMLPLALCSAALWGSGCGDDAATASDTATDSGSTSTAGTTGSQATSNTLTEGTTTGAALTTGTDSSSGSTDMPSGSSDDSGPTGSGGADSTSTSDSSGEGSSGTGGESAVCEEGGELVLTWNIEVIDGQFPDDLPTDLVADCVLGASAGATQLRVNCPELQMFVNIEATPTPSLPLEGEALELRFHRAPGPLGFPDLWLQMDFADGTELALAASSVLDPNTTTLQLPWNMSVSDQGCGPFTLEGPFGNPDSCGDQMWLGLNLDVMGQGFTTFHGTFGSWATASHTVDFWVGSARDYGTLPKFCDIAPRFFTTMTFSTPEM